MTLDVNQMSVAEIMAVAEKTGKKPRFVSEDELLTDGQSDQPAATDVAIPGEVVEARERSKAENKLLILDFTAAWCGPCQRLANETFFDDNVKRLLEKVVLLKIDADEYPEFTASQNVSSLPDVRFYTPDGTQLDRLDKFVEAEPFAKMLEKHLGFIAENSSEHDK